MSGTTGSLTGSILLAGLPGMGRNSQVIFAADAIFHF